MSRFMAVLAVVFFSSTALAQIQGGPPYGFASGTTSNMQRPGVPGVCRQATAATTQRAVTRESQPVAGGSSVGLACFGWGTQLRLNCTGNVRAAFVQSSTVTFGASGNPYLLADPEGAASSNIVGPASGTAKSVAFVEGDSSLALAKLLVVGAAPFYQTSTPTYRGLSCNAGNAQTAGFPCNGNSDCGAGGTCTINSQASCAFLMLKAVGESEAICQVCEER